MADLFDVNSESFGFMSHEDMRLAVIEHLQKAEDDGEGMDGRAMDLVLGMCQADGELYNDGECLELAGVIIDAWRSLNL